MEDSTSLRGGEWVTLIGDDHGRRELGRLKVHPDRKTARLWKRCEVIRECAYERWRLGAVRLITGVNEALEFGSADLCPGAPSKTVPRPFAADRYYENRAHEVACTN